MLLLWLGLCLALVSAQTCLTKVPNNLIPKVVIAQNAWTASALECEIARILLEEVIQIPVEIKQIDSVSQWAEISAGRIHACLEVWPSGYKPEISQYINGDQTILGAGPLGSIGQVGWWTQTKTLTQFPAMTYSSAFTDPNVTAIFNGTLFEGDPTYYSFDQPIIQKYGYAMNVSFLGSEDAEIAKMEWGDQNDVPVLMYFWKPHGLFAKVPMSRVALPTYEEQVDYPIDILLKIKWNGLATYSPSANFLVSSFVITTDDQIQMLGDVLVNGTNISEVACNWVNANKLIWQQWILPLPDIPEFIQWSDPAAIAILVITIASQLYIAVNLIIVPFFRKHPFMKVTSIPFLMLALLGSLIMLSVSYWLLGYNHFSNCIGAIIFGGMGFAIMWAAIIVKEYRIYKVQLRSKRLKIKTHTDLQLFLGFFTFVLIEAIIDILWLTVGAPDPTYGYCHPVNRTFMSLFIFYKFSLVLGAAFLAFKNAAFVVYMESFWLFSATVVFFVIMLIMMVVALAIQNVEGSIVSVCVGTAIAALFFWIIYLLPKLVRSSTTGRADAKTHVNGLLGIASTGKTSSSTKIKTSTVTVGKVVESSSTKDSTPGGTPSVSTVTVN